MSNKSISRQFFHLYGDLHDVEGATPLFADDAVINANTAPGPMDVNAYKQLGYAFLAGMPDMKVTVLEQIEEGDNVVSLVTWTGTHTGTLMGIPATGRFSQSDAITIDRIVDGKIKERREIGNLLSMMQQLGVLPMPGPA